MRHHHLHGRRSGRSGGWQQAEQPDASDAADWFAGRLPDGWFAGDPTVVVDREEITVIGRLKETDRQVVLTSLREVDVARLPAFQPA